MRRSGRIRKKVNYTDAGQDALAQKRAVRGFKKRTKFRKKIKKKAAPDQVLVRAPSALLRVAPVRREKAEHRISLLIGQKGSKSMTGPLSGKRREMLFMNPGDEKIMEAVLSIQRSSAPPPWALRFQGFLRQKNGKLWWFENQTELPFALKADKRHAVKRLYFDPREPSTIIPIKQKLDTRFANMTKRDVTHILKSLETYQLNFQRRRPPKDSNRFFFKKPGMICADLFFPSKHDGWEPYNCLTIMDAWSRFCGFYAIRTKKHEDILICMNDFLQKFSSSGHLPRRMLTDRGTDMAAATVAMEPFRQAKDKDAKLVLHPAAGQPVLLVEAMNAQVQRRMAIFSTSGLVTSPATILHEIAIQINNEPRGTRGGLTPIQMLKLNKPQQHEVNEKFKQKYVPSSELHGLPDLSVGDKVRLLKMTRKEQETNKLKGFSAKWSRDIHTVIRKTKLRKNPFRFQYKITGRDTPFYRHELLKLNGPVDQKVPTNLTRSREVATGGDYTPGEEWEHD